MLGTSFFSEIREFLGFKRILKYSKKGNIYIFPNLFQSQDAREVKSM